jgi:hypothetical protein
MGKATQGFFGKSMNAESGKYRSMKMLVATRNQGLEKKLSGVGFASPKDAREFQKSCHKIGRLGIGS